MQADFQYPGLIFEKQALNLKNRYKISRKLKLTRLFCEFSAKSML